MEQPEYSRVLQAEVDIPQPGMLLHKVHSLYRSQFRRWFGIIAPTSLMAGLVLLLSDREIKTIFRSFSAVSIRTHLGDLVFAGTLRFGSFFLSWLLGCFALAAIATVVNHSDSRDGEEVWRHDSYEQARQHLGAIFLAAGITFCAFLAGMVAIEFVPSAIVRVVGWARYSRYNYPVTILSYVVIASIVSWLGPSIPLLVVENIRLRAALRKSVRLCSGYEGALFLLVLESVLGGLVAWYLVLHGLNFVVPDHFKFTIWYGWVANLAGVLASAAVDPPLFLGLSLVANPELLTPSSLPGSQQAPQVHQLS